MSLDCEEGVGINLDLRCDTSRYLTHLSLSLAVSLTLSVFFCPPDFFRFFLSCCIFPPFSRHYDQTTTIRTPQIKLLFLFPTQITIHNTLTLPLIDNFLLIFSSSFSYFSFDDSLLLPPLRSPHHCSHFVM